MKMCFEWVIGRGDEWVAPRLLNCQQVVFRDPRVFEQVSEDDVS